MSLNNPEQAAIPKGEPVPSAEPQSSQAKGSIRLLRLFGTDVFIHWSWFLVAYYELKSETSPYSFRSWDVAEYLAGFGIVLLHEFGHVLACRRTGGIANRVVLWPLGGLAFVSPPQRPGACLWTTVAGPLVNVALIPILMGLGRLVPASVDFHEFIGRMATFNIVILAFNLLPIYPMDGGRILQAFLWWVIGLPWSLIVAGCVGVLASLLLLLLAVQIQELLLGAVAAFLLLGALNGVGSGWKLRRALKEAGRPPAERPWDRQSTETPADTDPEDGRIPPVEPAEQAYVDGRFPPPS